LIQFVSGKFGADISGFAIYLFGAFISGFAVCILNTVVNPMLNLLGGGGNRGNQLNLIGGTLNSLSGTLTPMLVGALIGTVTANTKMADINLVLFIALGVFAMAFIVCCSFLSLTLKWVRLQATLYSSIVLGLSATLFWVQSPSSYM